ncbi:MAG: hypothetical protein HOC34_00920 [Candidatus Magasanikbacteria bacterium]|jgi:bifunctional oligoribonuclease and PAP phosphatase NrnA|nr:hypothetical protein [Candidatus Magasanikbacteria bacterium]MBT4220708.1 hypothetical protein [Candidatus Magasanikbacteria bacterium]MBT4350053.1 hypothetical protein [Candidatus Magasanikbacteria bacterium]MBT4541504.1 hypothetical protein [Candidatus Magasanikbacteria bacterium]MBT6253032.1 hypothetical protein [Candidatus Magasanikbacteria bacterium]
MNNFEIDSMKQNMALSIEQQITKMLSDKKRILLVAPHKANGDAISCISTLITLLEGQGKQVDAVISGYNTKHQVSFLPHTKSIKNTLHSVKKCIIEVDLKKNGLQHLTYDTTQDTLRIFVTPKKGIIDATKIKTAQSAFKYDLIITLDTPDLLALGDTYNQHADLFHETPIINIDYKSTNEHFGQINVVHVTAASSAEALCMILQNIDPSFVNEKTATALLTGMIVNTRSFKVNNMRPKTLQIASELMQKGASREHIIKHLYYSRPINTLKLWGIALANLTYYKHLGLVSTMITREDFTRSGTKPEDLKDITDELIANSPEAKIIVILFEHKDNIDVIAYSTTPQDIKLLTSRFSPQGTNRHVTFDIKETTIKEAERVLKTHIEKIQQVLN